MKGFKKMETGIKKPVGQVHGYSIDTHPESGDKWARFTVTNLYCFRVTLIKKFIDYSNTGIYRIFISAAKVLKLGRFLSSSTSYGMLR